MFLDILLDSALAGLGIVITSLVMIALFQQGLSCWLLPLFSGDGRGVLGVWLAYLVAGWLSLGLQVVVGAFTPSGSLPLFPVLIALTTMAVIGSFRVVCAFFPGTNPNVVVVWLGGASTAGLFLFLEAAVRRFPDTDSVSRADIAVIAVQSLVMMALVELIVLGIKRGQRWGIPIIPPVVPPVQRNS